jgi:DNA-binding response OmpR family regulator
MTRDILVIDDDAAILGTIAEILLDQGYEVRTALGGIDGLAAIEEQPPALIILDMRMPGLDGWGVAKALRERNIVVPLIAMTAARHTRWGQEIGATYILEKPFDLSDLLDAVTTIVAL